MHDPFKRTLVAIAVLAYCSHASAVITYGAPDAQGRRVVIDGGGPIQGCNTGLVLRNGTYYCPGTALYNNYLERQAALEVAAAAAVAATSNSGNSGNSGGQQMGYMGADGQVHVSPSDASPTCDCAARSTTAEKDAADNAARDAVQVAADTNNDANVGEGGRGGGGGGRVICTELMRQGLLDKIIWRADLAFTLKHLSSTTVRGYHLWAIPYVRLMRRSPMAQRFIRPLATWRAEELAFQMGVLPKSNWKGKLLRWIGEPICFAIGVCAAEQNWQVLWTGRYKLESAA